MTSNDDNNYPVCNKGQLIRIRICSICNSEITTIDDMNSNLNDGAINKQIVEMMGRLGLATGHGSSVADLLYEIEWQVNEIRKKLKDG